ncbi:MAG: bifunctional adenosylcobinamide kinase/adenosylcobinamide-phosphate guanylyltransferase [Betaproteobacteria bacterium]|nr:bifunctional adenosylcobinamide kinase/adenosylcobinamide-phosphate guanylyltransferase [Betaproteobacteria bacterium]
MKELVLGGARSGKSAYAQRRATASGLSVTVVVTGSAGDDEMAERIAHHRAARPAEWRVVEAPRALAAALREAAAPGRCLIVDCLTLWLVNVIDGDFAVEREALLDLLPTLPGEVIFVANEIGLGIVPLGAETRRFRDEAGRLNQDFAATCQRVTFVAAGLPLALKTPQKT